MVEEWISMSMGVAGESSPTVVHDRRVEDVDRAQEAAGLVEGRYGEYG